MGDDKYIRSDEIVFVISVFYVLNFLGIKLNNLRGVGFFLEFLERFGY